MKQLKHEAHTWKSLHRIEQELVQVEAGCVRAVACVQCTRLTRRELVKPVPTPTRLSHPLGPHKLTHEKTFKVGQNH